MYSLILLFLGITIWSYSQSGICVPPPLSPQKMPIFFSHIADEEIDKKSFRQIFYVDTFFLALSQARIYRSPYPQK